MRNVQLIDSSGSTYSFTTNFRTLATYTCSKAAVDHIIFITFDSAKRSTNGVANPGEIINRTNISDNSKNQNHAQLTFLLPIAAFQLIAAYSCFADAGDINSDALQGSAKSDAENTKSRKTLIGALFAVTGVITAVIGLGGISFDASPSSVAMNYKLNINL